MKTTGALISVFLGVVLSASETAADADAGVPPKAQGVLLLAMFEDVRTVFIVVREGADDFLTGTKVVGFRV